jgi:hypothetical protein
MLRNIGMATIAQKPFFCVMQEVEDEGDGSSPRVDNFPAARAI